MENMKIDNVEELLDVLREKLNVVIKLDNDYDIYKYDLKMYDNIVTTYITKENDNYYFDKNVLYYSDLESLIEQNNEQNNSNVLVY